MRRVSWHSAVRSKREREVGHTSAIRARVVFGRWGLGFECLLDGKGP